MLRAQIDHAALTVVGNDSVGAKGFDKVEVVAVADPGAEQSHHIGLCQRRKQCAELKLVGSVQRIEQHLEVGIGHTHKLAVLAKRPIRPLLQLLFAALDQPLDLLFAFLLQMRGIAAKGQPGSRLCAVVQNNLRVKKRLWLDHRGVKRFAVRFGVQVSVTVPMRFLPVNGFVAVVGFLSHGVDQSVLEQKGVFVVMTGHNVQCGLLLGMILVKIIIVLHIRFLCRRKARLK